MSFTSSLNNRRSLILECLFDLELCTFSLLLSDLLIFDGLGILWSEMQVSDGNIIEHDVEIPKTFSEAISNLLGDLLSLG